MSTTTQATFLPSGLKWTATTGNQIPSDAIHAGDDIDGTPLYIARALHSSGTYQLGKASPNLNDAQIGYANKTEYFKNYDVLCGSSANLQWVSQSSTLNLNNIDGLPIVGGSESGGELLYCSRQRTGIQSSQGLGTGSERPIGLQPGKTTVSMGGARCPFDDVEYSTFQYDVLISKNQSGVQWVQASNGQIPNNAIQGGQENDSRGALYVSRASVPLSSQNSIQPGKAASHLGGGSYPANNKENFVSQNYEVLVGNPSKVKWVKQSGVLNLANLGATPVPGGTDYDGKKLYCVRANYAGGVQPGKIAVEFQDGAHIGADNKENRINDYEVLCFA